MATEVDDYGIIGDGPMKLLWERDGKTITFWMFTTRPPWHL